MQIGDIIYLDENNLDWYTKNVSDWCNKNNAIPVEIESIEREVDEKYTDEENGQIVEKTHLVTKTFRQFEIRSIPNPSEEEIAERKRIKRNELLADTDKYMVIDYPISEEERQKYIEYRKYLRDLPSSDEFPNIDILTFDQWSK